MYSSRSHAYEQSTLQTQHNQEPSQEAHERKMKKQMEVAELPVSKKP